MKKILFFLVVLFMFSTTGKAQSGLRIYGGASALDNEDVVLNPKGPNLGWHIGGDLQMLGSDMTILIGGRYTSVPYTINKQIFNTSTTPEINTVSTRIGLGFNILQFTRNFSIIGRLLWSIDYTFNVPLRSGQANAGFEKYTFTNSTATAVGGLGMRLGVFTIDAEYGYGLFNLISNERATNPTTYSVSAGIFF